MNTDASRNTGDDVSEPVPSLGPRICSRHRSRAGHPVLGIRSDWLDEHATQLRNLTLLVRPDLDDAVFIERVPTLDASPTDTTYLQTQIFVNGDSLIVPLSPGSIERDPENVATIRAHIEEALDGEGLFEGFANDRLVDAYLAGQRFRIQPGKAPESELIDFANQLLEAVGSPRRIVHEPAGRGRIRDRIPQP